jgi:hypothetical protein
MIRACVKKGNDVGFKKTVAEIDAVYMRLAF